MEAIATLMSFVFWGCLIWLIYAAVKKQDKKKPAIATAVTFVIAVTLNAVTSYPEIKKKELSPTQKRPQAKEKPVDGEVVKNSPSSKKQQFSKAKNENYLADYYEVRSQILDLSPRWEEENAVPVERNGIKYKRKLIKATTSFVEFVGIPKIIEVNYVLVPSTKNWQNLESLTLLGAITKYVCGEYDQKKNGEFIKKFSKHFAEFGDEETTYIGKCKAKLGKVDKSLPMAYITFTPRD